MSKSLQSHGLQQARLPCPSLSHSACSDSCPLSWWCHPTIPSPATPFSSCPQSFPVSGSFPMSQLFTSCDQSIGASALVLWMIIKGWFPLELTGLISLLSKGLSRLFSSTIVWKHQFFSAQPSLWSNSHIHTWLLDKTIALTIWTFVGKVMSLLFNILSRFVIAFLPRSKHLLMSWLQSLFSDFGAQENSLSLFPFFPHLFAMKWWDWMPWSYFLNIKFKLAFSPSISPSSSSLLPLCFLP